MLPRIFVLCTVLIGSLMVFLILYYNTSTSHKTTSAEFIERSWSSAWWSQSRCTDGKSLFLSSDAWRADGRKAAAQRAQHQQHRHCISYAQHPRLHEGTTNTISSPLRLDSGDWRRSDWLGWRTFKIAAVNGALSGSRHRSGLELSPGP